MIRIEALLFMLCLLGASAPALAVTSTEQSTVTTSTSTHHHVQTTKTHARTVTKSITHKTVTVTTKATTTQSGKRGTYLKSTSHATSVTTPARGVPRRLARLRPTHIVPPAAPPPPLAAAAAKPAPLPPDPAKGTATGLPLPRFAALRSDQVNWRAGPGTRYPIDWIYQRRDLPVRIEREFEVWRLVSEPDGTKGWVHQATLTGRRSFVITGDQQQTLRSAANDTAAAVAILKPGVIGQLQNCAPGSEWCAVAVKTFRGYLNRASFWGSLPGETLGQ